MVETVTVAVPLPPTEEGVKLHLLSTGRPEHDALEKLIVLLHDLAARVGTASDEHEYGDKQAVWLENGRKVLDYMEADERFSAASFHDSMEEQGIAVLA